MTPLPMTPGKLAFVISNNHCMLPDQFFWSYLKMMKPNGSFAVKGSSAVKCSAINDGIYQALCLGAEWVFLMDVDQTFPKNTIPRLLDTAKKHDAKIVSVLYHLGRPPYGPVAGWVKEIRSGDKVDYAYVNAKGEPWKDKYAPLGQGVVEVDWVGSGGVLIHREVLKEIGWPPFLDEWETGMSFRKVGHDITFSERAKLHGFKLYVDTAVVSEHGKFQYIDRNWAEAFNGSDMVDHMLLAAQSQALEADYWDVVWQEEYLKGYEREKQYEATFKEILGWIPEGATVADVGCGIGRLMEIMRTARNAKCVGYDFSEKAIEVVKHKGFDGHVADVRTFHPNGDSGKFDAVVSTHTLEHISDDHGFVKNLIALAKPGGKVIIATPSNEKVQDHFEHVRGYTDEELEKFIAGYFKKYEIKKNPRDYIVIGEVEKEVA